MSSLYESSGLASLEQNALLARQTDAHEERLAVAEAALAEMRQNNRKTARLARASLAVSAVSALAATGTIVFQLLMR